MLITVVRARAAAMLSNVNAVNSSSSLPRYMAIHPATGIICEIVEWRILRREYLHPPLREPSDEVEGR